MWDDGELFDSSYDFIGEKSGNHFVMVKSGKWGYLNGVGNLLDYGIMEQTQEGNGFLVKQFTTQAPAE